MRNTLYSIVTPVFKSSTSLQHLYLEIKQVFHTLGADFEWILVDDSGQAASWKVISDLHKQDSRIKGLALARNFGQHNALMCGFHYVQGDFVHNEIRT